MTYEVKLHNGDEEIVLQLTKNQTPGSSYRYKNKWWLITSVSFLREKRLATPLLPLCDLRSAR